MFRRSAFAFFFLLGACGEFPRVIALDHRVEPACDVVMASMGTSTTARAGATVTLEVDATRAAATMTSTCTLNGRTGPATCELEFGSDATENIRVDPGTAPTDLTIECPADRWPDGPALD